MILRTILSWLSRRANSYFDNVVLKQHRDAALPEIWSALLLASLIGKSICIVLYYEFVGYELGVFSANWAQTDYKNTRLILDKRYVAGGRLREG